ncbi:Pentatricopeptide repeat-containing protein [Rhynchospora pubera]|uniref:Pentatricopeptide repeat-containing protein n=1 Tax=Rhynchospora pubera TaxID=906938 RepID=A0AAV8G955_9POAL|nr:Pentatricopeptide repeat-containing protein [Rhynchospora pubera]
MIGSLTFHQTNNATFKHTIVTKQAPEPKPDEYKSCIQSPRQANSMEEFKKLHAQYIKSGLDCIQHNARELLVACALSNWGCMAYAKSIFLSLEEPETFDFNILIKGHVDKEESKEALLLYQEMWERDVKPDNFTLPVVIKACVQLSATKEGREVHGHATKIGFASDPFVQNGFINFYGKCGEIEQACMVFDKLGSNKTIASWTSIIAVHCRAGLWTRCLELVASMTSHGLRVDESSLVSAASSSAHVGSLDLGRSIHCYMVRNSKSLNVIMKTSLIDMYAQCGCIDKAIQIFESMKEKNIHTYGATISGLALHGDGKRALKIFSRMISEGIYPNEAIYVGILSACSRAGLLEEGFKCFDQMRFEHQIVPNPQHYGCMVDLLARSGRLKEAYNLINNMPMGPTDSALRSLLGSCKIYGNIEFAEYAIQKLRELNACNSGDYVILSDIYGKESRYEEMARMRTEGFDQGLIQDLGFSEIEVKGNTYKFVSHDRSHPWSAELYEMLHQIEWQLHFERYIPDTSDVSSDGDEEEKRRLISVRSQKLAVAFGLLYTSPGAQIRVISNFRMGKDCHRYMELVSQIFERKILVRDRNRFHCFMGGRCSCNNYW